MELPTDVRERIDNLVQSNKVLLFMKGTPAQPQCGFSATTIGILDSLLSDYATINVLEDPSIRDGIKAYSDWPTIPQLYIDSEFMGGCDVVKQMFNAGELHDALGVEPPDRTPPEVALSDEAAETIRNALADNPDAGVHLTIDSRWQHSFALGPAEGHEIKAEANGIEILVDLASIARARGLSIGVEESLQGRVFKIDNPNAPPAVKQMTVQELKAVMDTGESMHLFDTREEPERVRASIANSILLDQAAMQRIGELPKDAKLVFHCHHGPRSQSVAEHYRLQGYTNVHNVVGGIDAWSREVDPDVPRY